jgi:DNA-binding transcriptional LysR family regulator
MEEMGSMSPRDITLAQLRALIAVADRHGLSAAASAVGLTQSGVSQAVLALEETLGVPLLVRRRDGVVPDLALELRGRRRPFARSSACFR